MIFAAIFAIGALFVLLLLEKHSIASEREQWASERKELLNRIQAPERLPIPAGEPLDPLETDADELARVGVIDYEEDE